MAVLLFVSSGPLDPDEPVLLHAYLEDDFYRYLWEGGMVAHGQNPYQYSVREVLNPQHRAVPESLTALAEEAHPVPQRVNYPWLRTVYPPISQAAFSLAHLLSSWNLEGWKMVLFAADLLNLYLLFLLRRRLNLSPWAWVIYWWNPLLIKETYNSGHLEVILIPFILGALLFSIRARYLVASVALGLAAGIKLWPVILLPAVLKPVLGRPRQWVGPMLAFSGLTLLMLLPFLIFGLDSRSGLWAYLTAWEMNDSLCLLLSGSSRVLLFLLGAEAGSASLVARILALFLFGFWSFWLLRRRIRRPEDIISLFLHLTAGLFLLSPAQFPWYFLWMLPFLSLTPRGSLLLFTVLLPFYYLRFYLEAREVAEFFDYYLVWLQFVPVWVLLIGELGKKAKSLRGGMGCAESPTSR